MDHGGYVFISHSHQDIEKIRKIRNKMEEAGYEPLCFYLKCLTDNDEIEDLIKREINAREWFVYADSANARASNWVRKEREYIDSLRSKQTITVNLDDEKSMDSVASRLSTGMRVFVAYSRKDKDVVQKLAKALIRLDVQVFTDEEIKPGEDWTEIISKNLSTCENSGCVIPVFSKNSDSSMLMKNEIDHARDNGATIIPVIVEHYDASRYHTLNDEAAVFLNYDSSEEDYNRAAISIVDKMGNNLRNLFSKARSHNEITNLYFDSGKKTDRKTLDAMKEEADDRLDEERRIREDIEAAIESGTMTMTDELRRKLDELY